MAKARAGDRAAVREISGSCLRVALALAEKKWDGGHEAELFDFIQDGNAALLEALDTFTGSGAAEFLRHAETVVACRLAQAG